MLLLKLSGSKRMLLHRVNLLLKETILLRHQQRNNSCWRFLLKKIKICDAILKTYVVVSVVLKFIQSEIESFLPKLWVDIPLLIFITFRWVYTCYLNVTSKSEFQNSPEINFISIRKFCWVILSRFNVRFYVGF